MGKYIDADRLRAEINETKNKIVADALDPDAGIETVASAKYKKDALSDVLNLIDSLQQEQPEVDLNKEINRFLSNATIMNKGRWKGKYPISEMGFGVVAHHFFNLGLNARKA